jgi:hypothetical protein
MERKQKIIAGLTLMLLILITASVWHVNNLYNLERGANAVDISMVEFRFETVQDAGIEIVDVEAQKYSDVTFLDFEITASNSGDKELLLKNPVITFYLEDVYILNKTLEDIELFPEGSWSMRFDELTFETKAVENASLRLGDRPDETFIITGRVTSEYTFRLYNQVLKTYWLSTSFEGRIPLQEVFGGKTKEDAVDRILELSGFTSSEEEGVEPKRPSIPLPR